MPKSVALSFCPAPFRTLLRLCGAAYRPASMRTLIVAACGEIIINQPVFALAWTLPPKLSSTNGDNFIFAIAHIYSQKDWHAELCEFRLPFDGLDRQNVNVLIFTVEPSLLDLLDWLDIELVLSFYILSILLDFYEVRCERRPSLRGMDGPQINTPRVYSDGSNKRTMWVPL